MSSSPTLDADSQAHSLNRLYSTFTRLLSVLKDDILLCQPHNIPTNAPPPLLPPSIQIFASNALAIPEVSVSELWNVCKSDVWDLSDARLSPTEQELFRKHGWKLGLTSVTLYPPSHHCSNPDCLAVGPLKKTEQRQVVVYTHSDGVVPARAVHLYCRGCNTNYHHNFSVQGGMRRYYGNTPTFIQIGEHQFADRKLVGLWVSMMLLAWVSATNCARTYDMALSGQQGRDFAAGGWQFGSTLTTDNVWDAFIILTLLDYHDRKETCLQVPHTGDQKDRFTEAMRARNREVITDGQDEIAHCCDKCMRAWTDSDGATRDVQIIVGDGLSMGFRRCQAAHCTTELQSNRLRFCLVHANLEHICSIVGCDAPVVPGKKACTAPLENEDNGDAEDILGDEGDEWFEQIEGDGAAAVAIYRQVHPGSIGIDDSAPCEAAKSDTGNRKYKALFGGLRTHNEQILVRPCGVIVSRATFYNAEAVSNVLLHLQKTFSVPRAVKPEHFVYDTNCDARQQVLAHPDEWAWFLDVGMSVDVFHFLNKHSVTHTFCQEHCNPAMFPELMDEDGGWFFNTSVAEQTNVWLGGYHSMCREMKPVKYSFFLDEMIRLRNEITVAKLAVDGHHPRTRIVSSAS
ncbi:hypothetical protein MSAN_01999500 [Mycena sanguinolenta]|uniref:CxC5 like cysteine cluster associated with KDZ domain-containing protein n=1 Tax=Mycena sanguinolenta TaxID=230812 RepID=A0A8H7CM67_9AGAR|nr:hypothetical protein MSAN_01999500 [Mycena sanguinolenta]